MRSAIVVLASVLAAPSYAMPRAIPATQQQFKAFGAHAKMVRFEFRNDAAQTIEILAGERIISLAPKQTISLALTEGSTLVANQAFSHYAKGDVLFHINREQDGNTLAVR